jgi:hypothetical protein
MSCFAVYGKRCLSIFDTETKKTIEPDKSFAPLAEDGTRTTKAKLTNVFAEKSDAQEWIDKHNFKDGVKLEIRKV